MTEISKEHRAAIGTVVYEWGQLNSVVEVAVWGLCGLRHVIGATITTNMGFKARRDALATLFTLWREVHPADAAQIEKITSAIRDAETERNNLLHQFMWSEAGDPDQVFVIGFTAYGELRFKPRRLLTVRQIEAKATKIKRANALLRAFLRQNNLDARKYERPPWLRIPSTQDSQSE